MLAVQAEALEKHFGSVRALDGVSFSVAEATVCGLLGANGAGKTTAIRVLTTLLPPDAGRAAIMGYDVVREPQLVRSAIGLTGQSVALDAELTGRHNLVFFGRLARLRKRAARQRAADLIDRLALPDAADRAVGTYSSGMRRRLDLAASLMVPSAVLFLDEPTTGLDPTSRLGLWDVIRELKNTGTTVVLTTQYLEEADVLSDNITIVHQGRVVADGTPSELKALLKSDTLELRLRDREATQKAADALGRAFALEPKEIECDVDAGRLQIPVKSEHDALQLATQTIHGERIEVEEFHLRRPSLDEVFIALTVDQPSEGVGTPEPT